MTRAKAYSRCLLVFIYRHVLNSVLLNKTRRHRILSYKTPRKDQGPRAFISTWNLDDRRLTRGRAGYLAAPCDGSKVFGSVTPAVPGLALVSHAPVA